MAEFPLFNNLPFELKALIIGQDLRNARGTERHITLQCMRAYAERASRPTDDEATLFNTREGGVPSPSRKPHCCSANPKACYTLKHLLNAACTPTLPDTVVARIAFLANFTELNVSSVSAYDPNHDFRLVEDSSPRRDGTYHAQPEDFTTGASYVSKAVLRAFSLRLVSREFGDLAYSVACTWQAVLPFDVKEIQEHLSRAWEACRLPSRGDRLERERRLGNVVARLVAVRKAEIEVESEVVGLEEFKRQWVRLGFANR